jgi:ribosome biogenesis GTPase / thiamine phosphate phosphatase
MNHMTDERWTLLQTLGLPRALLPAVADLDTHLMPMRVTAVHRDGVAVHDGLHEYRAHVQPALLRALQDASDAIAVGDWVGVQLNAMGEHWVIERVPPINQIARRVNDGRDKTERTVIVANVDTALLVMGLDHDFNLRRLERQLAFAKLAQVTAVVVLTKADLCDDLPERERQVQALLPGGVALVSVNALDASACDALAPWLGHGQTLVVIGSSGAGKSTLTNTLCGLADAQALDTGPNRAGDNRGRHTTTARTLHRTQAGACIIDTPGLRTLRLDADPDDVVKAFDDVARLAPRCRFRNCSHVDEPGCAVRDALDAARLKNFHKLQREAQRDQMTALERKRQLGEWKVRSKAAKARVREKAGG